MIIFEGPIHSFFLILKVIFGILSLGLFGSIVYFLLKTEWLKKFLLTDLFEFFSFKPYEMRGILKRWAKILKKVQKIKAGKEAEVKLAIIEADDLLNEALEKMGYKGKTLGEKLKHLPQNTLSVLDELWKAHQIRSNIVHDPTYKLTPEQALEILRVYEKALLELEVL